MKIYHEMIQWIVDQVDNNKLRHHEWAAIMAISQAYGIPQQTVFDDVRFEKNFRERAKAEQRRTKNRESNEQRRLANLIRNQNEQ